MKCVLTSLDSNQQAESDSIDSIKYCGFPGYWYETTDEDKDNGVHDDQQDKENVD